MDVAFGSRGLRGGSGLSRGVVQHRAGQECRLFRRPWLLSASHSADRIYAAEARKTFFVWGGSVAPNARQLRIMVSYYDHAKGVVPRPVIVRDCGDFNDAHANPALSIDDNGHLWVFAAMRHVSGETLS